MKKGVFHKRLDNTSVAVDLCAIVQVTHAWGAHSCLGNTLMPGEHTLLGSRTIGVERGLLVMLGRN